MKAALAQIDTRQADPEGNARRILVGARRAHEAGAELAIFPELALPGYGVGDWLLRRDFLARVAAAELALAAALPAELAVLFGSVGSSGRVHGKSLENTAVLVRDGRVLARRGKTLLPTYDVFDERRWFEPTPELAPVALDGRSLGVTICEDVWNDQPIDAEIPRYADDPPHRLVAQGADVLLNLSASPYARGRPAQREELMRRLALRLDRPLVLVNLVGGNDDLIFDGHSVAIDRHGRVIARACGFAEDLVVFDLGADGRLPALAPVQRHDPAELDELQAALVLGLRDYVHKCGFRRVVLGLSGGVDSALVALLAAEALGPDAVDTVAMPSAFSAAISSEDAATLAGALGLRHELTPIERLRGLVAEELAPLVAGEPRPLTRENVQPRLRGLLLMALANDRDALLLATGNKSEIAVGYCTLYGDMCGALAPIADLAKTTVYALVRHVDEKLGHPVPERILTRDPSAELAPGQLDRHALPDYVVLDEILRLAVEEGRGEAEIAAAGFEKHVVADVCGRLWRAEYKRRQMPPALRVTRKAFGRGWRMPLAAGAPPAMPGEESG